MKNQYFVSRRIASRCTGSMLLLFLVTGCGTHTPQSSGTLIQARSGFKTTLTPQNDPKEAVLQAPPDVFRTVTYPAPSGELAAYVSPDPGDGKQHPVIIWIHGGDSSSIGDEWSPRTRDNDQSAAAYRNAGILMMFPSLRGGNENPGVKEGFLGEVDDVLAAARYLETQKYVDPKRIYLGGHSTGGTLALLEAEYTDGFRAVFSFGPIDDVSHYGSDSGFLPFDISNQKEVELRSPGFWLNSIQSPVWVFEGTEGSSNARSLRAMARSSTSVNAHFIQVRGATHFTTLAPINELIAQKILQDTGEPSTLSFTEDEVNQKFAK